MHILQPLAHRPISLLWAGQVLSATGSEFYMIAVLWTAAGLIGRDAGYVSALQAGALLVGSLLGGVVTDGWRNRTTMIVADILRMVLVLALFFAGLAGPIDLTLLVTVAIGVALASSLFDPALQATLPAIAPDPGLRHATNALFDATRRLARILGPGLVSLVSGIMPESQFFAITAATFSLSAVAVKAAIGEDSGLRRQGLTGSAAITDSLTGGWKAVKHHPVLLYGLCVNLVGNATWGMGVLLGMLLLLRQTRPDPLTDYSCMMAAYGVGNLAANLVLGSMRSGRPAYYLIVSKLIFGLGVFLLPVMPGRGWLMAAAAFAAVNGPFETLSMLQLMQSELPKQRVAQAYRLQMCGVFSGLLLAYTAAPSLFDGFGLIPVIMASGAVTFTAGLIGFVVLRSELRLKLRANAP